ncbi:hypothetical protein [Jannaschia marina]|uniref:hypothetical protein n=1 Tax=Jannaschia marina TaxID=2741674 RepID=UPI0015CECAB8|nr:hypothetical protein [Jannaschia marina]
MNFCFNGLKTGSICLGDTMAQLHGEEFTSGHLGLGILGLLALAVFVFIIRKPA